jgi:hypothetical protein
VLKYQAARQISETPKATVGLADRGKSKPNAGSWKMDQSQQVADILSVEAWSFFGSQKNRQKSFIHFRPLSHNSITTRFLLSRSRSLSLAPSGYHFLPPTTQQRYLPSTNPSHGCLCDHLYLGSLIRSNGLSVLRLSICLAPPCGVH